jgi:aryl-alcohol dehydrogenase-like predicted oxidoreductase
MAAMRRAATGATIGIGDVSVARAAARGVDLGDLTRAVHAAIELGIELVEVAAEDAAERGVGDTVRSLRARDRVTVACRVPHVPERLGVIVRDVLTERLPVRYVQERVEASLRATRLDALPLAQLSLRAAWRAERGWPELVGTCERLVREGKVLAWGAIVDTVEDDSPELAGERWLSTIQVTFNACDRTAEPVIAAARANQLAVLARRPLAGGALAGALGPGVRLALGDDRRAIPDRELEAIAVAVAKLSAFVKRVPPAARSCAPARDQLERNAPRAERDHEALAELALRFAIDRGTIPLPRIHHREHVAEAVGASIAPALSAELMARIEEILPPRDI